MSRFGFPRALKSSLKHGYALIRPAIPDVVDEVLNMWRSLGYFPNVWKPRSFNEKIAHRKLFQYDERYARLADKWRVREYVRDKVGQEFLTRVFGYALDPNDIDPAGLPDSFVIKATHDCGSTIIVDHKSDADWSEISRFLRDRLSRVYGVLDNQYWYAEIPPAIIVEERLMDKQYGVPVDYKFFVFHGSVKVIQVIVGRFGQKAQGFYDRSWRRLPVLRPGSVSAPLIERPRQLGTMIEVAEALGSDFDFVRVDLYAPNDERVVFGELTFAPAAGRAPFLPRSFDFELGTYW